MASDGKRRGGKGVCNVTGRGGRGDSGIREIETVFFICQDPRNGGEGWRKDGTYVSLARGRVLSGFFFRLLSRSLLANKKSFGGCVKRSVNVRLD